MKDGLPTLLDISPTGGLDLDEKTALNHFFGKTVEEATALFGEIDFHYLEDLMWMGSKGFTFYYPAFRSYFRNDPRARNETTLGFFLMMLESRMRHQPETITSLKEEVIQDLLLPLHHYSEFGDTDENRHRIIQLLQQLGVCEM